MEMSVLVLILYQDIQEAMGQLYQDIRGLAVLRIIQTAVLKEISVPLTSNQKIALASFAFNLGPNCLRKSSIVANLQKGDYKAAANCFDLYIKQRNTTTGEYEILQGLINRRKREKELFLTPDGE